MTSARLRSIRADAEAVRQALKRPGDLPAIPLARWLADVEFLLGVLDGRSEPAAACPGELPPGCPLDGSCGLPNGHGGACAPLPC